MFGYTKRTRVTLTTALAAALALATGAPMARAGSDNGQCPGLTAAQLDTVFLDWLGSEAATYTCTDDPSVPSIVFAATKMAAATGNNTFYAEVTSTAELTTGPSLLYGDVAWGNDITNLTIPQRYVCRGEVLRSVAWREHCAGATGTQ